MVELIQTFWEERKLIAKITAGFIGLGLLIALFSPVKYTSEATLVPETSEAQGMAGGLLEQYGGLLGINSGDLAGQKAVIPPQQYPDIAESLPYQIELMQKPIRFVEYDTTASVHQFYTDIYTPSLFGYMGEYTLGLPGKVLDLFKKEDKMGTSLPVRVNRDSILSINKEQKQTVELLRNQFSVSVNEESGLVQVSVELPDPQAAAEVARAGITLLKEHVKAYRTEKARRNLTFVKGQVDKAKKRFQQIQEKLAEFRDSNINLATAKAQTREQELQSQYDLAFNLYNSLSQQLEQAKMQLQQDTPVLSTLQPVSVPLEESSPQRLLILIVSTMLGFLVALGYILTQKWWRDFYLN